MPKTAFVRFGDVAFSTKPFELFLDFGNYVKTRSNAGLGGGDLFARKTVKEINDMF